MNKQIINIDKGQWLTDVLENGMIPSNVILNKLLPNLGATHSEIIAPRNSIIIVPNLPVIKGKIFEAKKDPTIELLGVYEGVNIQQIKRYIIKKSSSPKKIITTPEGFCKIKEAMKEARINMFENYFLLYDEIHQVIQDVDFRENIIYPLDDFFKFNSKAMISATPIYWDNPLFKKHMFSILEIKPTYPYKQNILAICTNNVISSTQRVISKFPDETISFFCNSIQLADAIITQTAINKDDVSIFCSEKSQSKLKESQYTKVYTDIAKTSVMSKYNFFTSRFFNAVDIKLDYKPLVILLTDNFRAEQTQFDINTTVIQCIGRFRNGTKGNIHISNINRKIQWSSPEICRGYILGLKQIYSHLNICRNTAHSEMLALGINEILKTSTFTTYINSDGSLKYESIANSINGERTKSYYSSRKYLENAYISSPYFNCKFTYEYLDKEKVEKRTSLTAPKKEADLWREIVENLDRIVKEYGKPDCYASFYIEPIKESHPFISEAFFALGKDELERLNYKKAKIELAMFEYQFHQGKNLFPIVKEVYHTFRPGQKYAISFIKEQLNQIYTKYGYFKIWNQKSVTANRIKEFFEVEDNHRIQKARAMCLLRRIWEPDSMK